MTAITDLSALELSRAIHDRMVSCREVIAAYLERIGRINPKINAIVSLRDAEELMREAGERDAELDAGRSQGWMHGLPHAVKDLAPAKGIPCVFGSENYRDFVPDFDDIQVERIRALGAIIIGKTNTPEMGLGSHTFNPVFGPTRNPYDTGKSAGGSSGGAAAALAARLVPVADGSDMMGSLRNPAGFNNVVGYRPSYGRVPALGRELFLGQLAVNGPMARNVADVAALLAVQTGYDIRDPHSLSDEAFVLDPDVDMSSARIGWLGDYGGYLPFYDGVPYLCRDSLELFRTIGCRVGDVTHRFDMARVWDSWRTLRHFLVAGGQAADYADPARRANMKPEMIWEVENGNALTAAQVFAASSVRSDWYRYMCGLFEEYDFLVLPTAQVFPFDVTLDWPKTVGGKAMDTYHRWMEVVIGPSMLGLPVAAMPAGFGSNGLPAGIQIIGRPRADLAVLHMAAAYESRTDWLSQAPAIAK